MWHDLFLKCPLQRVQFTLLVDLFLLGLTWFSEAEPNKNGNIFISPATYFIALSMVYNGADSVTKEEITKVLQVEGMHAKKLNQANASHMNLLHSS